MVLIIRKLSALLLFTSQLPRRSRFAICSAWWATIVKMGSASRKCLLESQPVKLEVHRVHHKCIEMQDSPLGGDYHEPLFDWRRLWRLHQTNSVLVWLRSHRCGHSCSSRLPGPCLCYMMRHRSGREERSGVPSCHSYQANLVPQHS